SLVQSGPGLDTALVDRLGHEGISYTPSVEEARRRVDEGEAAVAVLLRPTPIDAVRDVATRGETMPQKSTYFFPKLLSGLLFFPLCHAGLARRVPRLGGRRGCRPRRDADAGGARAGRRRGRGWRRDDGRGRGR